MVDIKNKLEKNSILLSVLYTEFYNKLIIDLMQNLKDEKICYVTLNKPTNSLIKDFKFNRINTKNIFFIDAVSFSINKNNKLDNGILISSPSALTELSIAISEILKSKTVNLLIFDSLSSLKIYSNERTTIRFTSDIINRLRSNEFKGIFTCLEDDVKTNLIQKSSMHVDEIVDFKDVAEKLRKVRTRKTGVSLAFVLVLMAALSFLNTSDNKITGLVSSPLPAKIDTILLMFFAAIAMIISVILYKKRTLAKAYSLKNMSKPMEISSKSKLRSKFRNKITKWLNKKSTP